MYDYHYWMTHQMLEACERLMPTQWSQPMGHSWGNVHGVVTHMLAAELIWYARWQGQAPAQLAQAEDYPTLADVRAAWASVEAQMRAFLTQLDNVRLNADFTYTNTRGQQFSAPLGQVMLHVANHATHHRGELVGMLALLDVPHPEDDLLWYILQQREK
ncbi:MAG: DinB family protein [Anaerolineales bacterium]|nr:DinB family protein [Anaerolineales bacterium]